MSDELLLVVGEMPTHADFDDSPSGSRAGSGPTASSWPRAAAGTDLTELDRLGMRIAISYEVLRLASDHVAILPDPTTGHHAERDLVVDVSSPPQIAAAIAQSTVARGVFDALSEDGISELWPGFDILTIRDGYVDRLIELKSSTGDATVQAMSWNEWTTAQGPRSHEFWLYLVGNLRADLRDAPPFVRAVHDPVGNLRAQATSMTETKQAIQLRVREFASAEELRLDVIPEDADR